MKTLTEFKAWLNAELQKYPMIAKSNPISMNELCYVLRMSEMDFCLAINEPSEFGFIPSVKETFIPSRDLVKKIKIVNFFTDGNSMTVNVEFKKGK